MVSVSNDFSTTNAGSMQRYQARDFARASKKDVANMAVLQYSIENQDNERKYTKRINRTINTLPVLAVASGLAAKKGAAMSLASGATWGLALLAPDVVVGLNRKLTAVSPRIKRTEEKHPGLTFLAGAATSIGAFIGSVSLVNKAIANPKIKGVLSSAGAMAKDVGKAIKDSKFAQSIGVKVSNLAASVKGSKIVQSAVSKVNNSETLSNIAKGAKSLGKNALTHLPELAMFGVFAAIVGKSISAAGKINNNKKSIEQEQLKVANRVIDSYEAENEELRNIIFPEP